MINEQQLVTILQQALAEQTAVFLKSQQSLKKELHQELKRELKEFRAEIDQQFKERDARLYKTLHLEIDELRADMNRGFTELRKAVQELYILNNEAILRAA